MLVFVVPVTNASEMGEEASHNDILHPWSEVVMSKPFTQNSKPTFT